jgi:DNA helicase-2/ATP-dependent DNA helicase PcrA
MERIQVFKPRPKQQAVLAYQGGRMGVSAVPGSGKTWTLSMLAAKLVLEAGLEDDQEVLIVTLVNSAVDNFSRRVGSVIREAGFLPNIGYRVRTLHGLAHDIVRERPDLVGLSDDFQIIDQQDAQDVLLAAAQTWLRDHVNQLDGYLAQDQDERKMDWVRRDKVPDLVVNIANSFIKLAKDLQQPPQNLRYILDTYPEDLVLMEMGYAIYTDYQRALAYRGAVDFDDLVRLALQALRLDPEYLRRLRYRWPYILEDEAQDSSRLQERILQLLAGPEQGWVRVGDPNQAIYETFTTANPRFLRQFINQADVESRDLPNSGRSMQSIIDLANYLIDWSRDEHPCYAVRDALTPPYIEPTPAGDPQPNPEDKPADIQFIAQGFSPQAEIVAVTKSLQRWLPAHMDQTVAVLVPRNVRGFEVVDALKAVDIPHIELLRSTPSTREAAGALGNVIRYLSDPTSVKYLVTLYRVWRRGDRDDEALQAEIKEITKTLAKCQRVEDFIWPRGERDWLNDAQDHGFVSEELADHLILFRDMVRRWQLSAELPIDQLVLTLAQDLFIEPADLAIAHKIALVLHRSADNHPEWRLPELAIELAQIAKNERRFLGFTDEDVGFDPDVHKGKVVVATMHKAKGLEWDKVYLMSVNDYNFPSAQPQDSYISEPWYIRDHLNLEAETLDQLTTLHQDAGLFLYDEGTPTLNAREEYASERLRLLYVGITRAKRELVVTWNVGQRGNSQPSIPFIALQTWYEQLTHQKHDRDSEDG